MSRKRFQTNSSGRASFNPSFGIEASPMQSGVKQKPSTVKRYASDSDVKAAKDFRTGDSFYIPGHKWPGKILEINFGTGMIKVEFAEKTNSTSLYKQKPIPSEICQLQASVMTHTEL